MTQAKLDMVKQTTNTVKQFEFELNDEEWEFIPGQHTVLHLDVDGEDVARPYTMITRDGTDRFCLAIKEYPDGELTPHIHDLEEGDKAEFDEPSGSLHIEGYEGDAVFISTGTGATPMYVMLRDYLQNGEAEAFYFHGEKTREDIMFRQELAQLESEHDNLTVVYSLTDESWHGREGYIQEHVPEVLDSLDDKTFYICGVPAAVVQTQDLLEEHGVEEEDIVTEGWESDAVE
jgi:ferredoxin-NADP reductase